HYKLDVGLLQPGDPADFIVVKDLQHFEVLQTYVNGQLVAEKGESKMKIPVNDKSVTPVNNFHCTLKQPHEFAVIASPEAPDLMAIEALNEQLITNKVLVKSTIAEGKIVGDVENDILKIVVINRYHDATVAKAFIKGFGLQKGAIASSVAHDSHNVVAVGVDDESICRAVNKIIEEKGGISLIDGSHEALLPLPVAGLMSSEDGYEVARDYARMDRLAKDLGSPLSAPFMTLSFMALLVIPHLKLSDKGLFDGDAFALV
ncbi:MAG: adenine deaminase C-terminal domain-containing protein, partial [Chitinophagaceae bacterium]